MIHKQIKLKINPVSIFEEFKNGESVLLESASKGNYSYIGVNPHITFKSKGKSIKLIRGGISEKKKGDPFVELKRIIGSKKIKRGKLPLFYSGAIGYIGYEAAHFIEKLPKNKDDLRIPELYFIFPKLIFVIDHKRGVVDIILHKGNKVIFEKIIDKIKKIRDKKIVIRKSKSKCKIKSNFSFTDYKKAIEKAKNHVLLGDSYQIKISQRLESDFKGDPLELYKVLREINPSPYSAYVDFKDVKLVSCSPEHLLKVEKGIVETRPIGGTYPRGRSKKEDLHFQNKFFNDKKELAEHTMLIDIERNDLNRVCEPGSVKLSEKMVLEKYSHVMHIVSNIKGNLRGKNDVFDAIKAIFPGGSITGCPKIKTMELISELEPCSRGPYTGSIGFINNNNECDFNIIIRTFVIKDKKAYIQVGGGIVSDSDAEREYSETIDKGSALLEAINHDI